MGFEISWPRPSNKRNFETQHLNNQRFKLQLSTAQARRQKKLTAQAKQQKKFRNPTIKIISDLTPAQARRQKKLQHPTRPVENVTITTKGLQERKTQLLNGTTVKKGEKKILTDIFPLVHEKQYLKVLLK